MIAAVKGSILGFQQYLKDAMFKCHNGLKLALWIFNGENNTI